MMNACVQLVSAFFLLTYGNVDVLLVKGEQERLPLVSMSYFCYIIHYIILSNSILCNIELHYIQPVSITY